MNIIELLTLVRVLTTRLDAAKRGLALANKLVSKSHKSRIMGNMNRIRAQLNKAKKALSLALPI